MHCSVLVTPQPLELHCRGWSGAVAVGTREGRVSLQLGAAAHPVCTHQGNAVTTEPQLQNQLFLKCCICMLSLVTPRVVLLFKYCIICICNNFLVFVLCLKYVVCRATACGWWFYSCQKPFKDLLSQCFILYFSCSYLISKTVFENRFFCCTARCDKGLPDFNYGIHVK